MPVMIAVARMYRGEHHPTDILASVLFAALWLTAATLLIQPNQDAFRRGPGRGRGSRRGLRLPHRGRSEADREAEPATS
jgi:membrane-associated phospholipid phosphatase